MAVQKSKKSRARRGMRRSHDAISGPTLTVDRSSFWWDSPSSPRNCWRLLQRR